MQAFCFIKKISNSNLLDSERFVYVDVMLPNQKFSIYFHMFLFKAAELGQKLAKKDAKKKEADELNMLFRPVMEAQKLAKGT